MSVQFSTHVPNVRAHVSNAPHVRAIIRLQDVQVCSVVNTCKVCIMHLQRDYSTVTVRRQHYEPLIFHRYSVK
jgi:hypothetical protein